jgi:hypothetical protein
MEDVRICGAHLQAGQAVLHRGAAAPGRAVETEQLPRSASWTASWRPRGQSSEDGAGVRGEVTDSYLSQYYGAIHATLFSRYAEASYVLF